MASFNLLPWREIKRQREDKRLLTISVIFWLMCAIVALLAVNILSNRLDNQKARNKFLKDKIAILDTQIKDIKELKEKKKNLIGRIEIIQGLQQDRMQIVHILDDLVQKTPLGITFDTLLKEEKQIKLNGRAQANSRVSELMRKLDTSRWFGNATLTEIDIKESDVNRLSTFKVSITEKLENTLNSFKTERE